MEGDETKQTDEMTIHNKPTIHNEPTIHKKHTEMTIDEYKYNRTALLQDESAKQIKIMETLVSRVKSDDKELQLQASNMIGNILTMNAFFKLDIPWKQLTEKTFLNQLVRFLYQKELPPLQYESLVIISTLAEKSFNITDLVCNGAIPALVDLLNSSAEITRLSAVTALGNIAKESEHLCQLVIACDALEQLLPVISTTLNRQNASRILRGFCNLKPKLKADTVKHVLSVLEKNLNSDNEDILTDSCWTIVSLADVDESRNLVAANLDVCYKLIDLLGHNSSLTVAPVLEALANIMTNCQMETKVIQQLLDKGLLRHLSNILLSKYGQKTNTNICLIVRTISEISRKYAEDVVCYGIIYILSDLFGTSDHDFKKEVVGVILAVTLRGTDDAMRIMGVRCMEILSIMLDPSDSLLSQVWLRAIACIWKACGPQQKVVLLRIMTNDIDNITKLQEDVDVETSNLAKKMVNEFKMLNVTPQQMREFKLAKRS